MSDDDKQLVINAVIVAFFITAGFIWIFSNVNYDNTNRNRFEVVDQYEGCDVVQYYYPGRAEYTYFLHCKEGAAPRP